MKKVIIAKNDLIDLYKYKKKTIYEIAKIYKCSPACISNQLKRSKINTWWKPVKLKSDDLEYMYAHKKMSMKEVAKHVGCSQTTIVSKIHRFGIQSRKTIPIVPKGELGVLYHKNKLYQRQIAKLYHCNQATISNRMRFFKILSRTKSEISSKYPRYDFSRDLIEKAYIIGFRIGDLHVRKHRLLISVSTTTTRFEQIALFKNLFEKYGHVNIRPHRSKLVKGAGYSVGVLLNKSFDFLLPKEENIPSWILKEEKLFMSFFAGYIDAEGCLSICKKKKNQISLAIIVRTYEKTLLEQVWKKLDFLGILCPRVRLSLKRGLQNNKKDFWVLGIYRKKQLIKLLEMLSPHISHEAKKSKLKSMVAILHREQKL